MKRFATSVLALVMALGLSACGDSFTDLTPESERNAGNFYDTPGDFQIAINGIYDALQADGTYGGDYWIIMEMRSDNTDQGPDVTGLSAAIAALNEFKEIPTSEVVQRVWTDSYVGVARSNTVLARLGGVDMPEAQRQQFEGEALFLRSLMYYNLAMAFGNITLILDETTSPNQAINQVPAGDVFAQIAGDLQRAATLLPASYGAGQEGRATAGAARTLLAKVLLMQGQRGEAASVLREVVSSSQYQLLDDYASLWGPSNENNAESIFEVQFQAGGIGEGSPFATLFSPILIAGGAYRNRPTDDLIAAYEDGDLRFAPSLATSYVDPADGETVEDPFIRKLESVPFADFDADNNVVVFRYADVLLMLAEALGEGSEAYGLINQVRARAGLAAIDASTPGTFEEKLLQERRVELAFENHRWFDLRRFNQTSVVVDNELFALGGGPVNDLFPIPQREIDTAPEVMQQNPGYN
ncbi:MAG: RagB/SusD family nutrient uptake outer membrane protein [Bacteroidota bacterium]